MTVATNHEKDHEFDRGPSGSRGYGESHKENIYISNRSIQMKPSGRLILDPLGLHFRVSQSITYQTKVSNE